MDTIWHILSVIASLSVPFIAWLGKSYLDLHNRLIKAETLLEERSKTLKEVTTQQSVDSHRITQNDTAIAALEGSLHEFRGNIDKRLTEMTTRLDNFGAKLEILPTINAHLENLANLHEKIVLREVHDTQMAALGDRMASIEVRLDSRTKSHRATTVKSSKK